MWGIIHIILSVPQNILMDLNNVMEFMSFSSCKDLQQIWKEDVGRNLMPQYNCPDHKFIGPPQADLRTYNKQLFLGHGDFSWTNFSLLPTSSSCTKVGKICSKFGFYKAKSYTKFYIKCHMVINITMVTIWMILLMNKWTNIVMDDEWVHPLVKTLPTLVNKLWWNIVMDDWILDGKTLAK